jgi:hypothetical protein
VSSVLRFEWARGTRGQGEPARAAPGWNVRACVVANGTRAPALQLVWPAQAPEVGEGERQERCQRRSDRQFLSQLEHRAARFARTNERVGGWELAGGLGMPPAYGRGGLPVLGHTRYPVHLLHRCFQHPCSVNQDCEFIPGCQCSRQTQRILAFARNSWRERSSQPVNKNTCLIGDVCNVRNFDSGANALNVKTNM